MTVSSGPGTLQANVGANTFHLTAHSNETIQASGQAGEDFAYMSGFGSSDVIGFQAGANDQLQLQASMFSGLTAGNATADWALLLSTNAAVRSGADVTISDRAGDVLRLNDTTLASLTASAASVFKFV